MSRLLAIDPGPVESAWVLYDTDAGKPLKWSKQRNDEVMRPWDLVMWPSGIHALAVEMIASYGMAVGAEVFETCVWTGRYIEWWSQRRLSDPIRVYRRDVKLHLCGSSRAKDANVRQALIDRYGPGKDKAIGLKKSPGPLYGMTGDCWAALGVAVTAADTMLDRAHSSCNIRKGARI